MERRVERVRELESQMDRDNSALQPVSISLATNDSNCCTTTNGLSSCTILSPLSLSFSVLPFYLSVLNALLSFHFTAPPRSHFYHALDLLFLSPVIALLKLSNASFLSYVFHLFHHFFLQNLESLGAPLRAFACTAYKDISS